MDDREQLRIVLTRLIEENTYTLEDYGRWEALAEKAGEEDASQAIKKARQAISEGTGALKGALDKIA